MCVCVIEPAARLLRHQVRHLCVYLCIHIYVCVYVCVVWWVGLRGCVCVRECVCVCVCVYNGASYEAAQTPYLRRPGPKLEPGTVVVYVINASRNGLNIGRKVGPCPGSRRWWVLGSAHACFKLFMTQTHTVPGLRFGPDLALFIERTPTTHPQLGVFF